MFQNNSAQHHSHFLIYFNQNNIISTDCLLKQGKNPALF